MKKLLLAALVASLAFACKSNEATQISDPTEPGAACAVTSSCGEAKAKSECATTTTKAECASLKAGCTTEKAECAAKKAECAAKKAECSTKKPECSGAGEAKKVCPATGASLQ